MRRKQVHPQEHGLVLVHVAKPRERGPSGEARVVVLVVGAAAHSIREALGEDLAPRLKKLLEPLVKS